MKQDGGASVVIIIARVGLFGEVTGYKVCLLRINLSLKTTAGVLS